MTKSWRMYFGELVYTGQRNLGFVRFRANTTVPESEQRENARQFYRMCQ